MVFVVDVVAACAGPALGGVGGDGGEEGGEGVVIFEYGGEGGHAAANDGDVGFDDAVEGGEMEC